MIYSSADKQCIYQHCSATSVRSQEKGEKGEKFKKIEG